MNEWMNEWFFKNYSLHSPSISCILHDPVSLGNNQHKMWMTFRQFRNGLVGVILRAVGLWRDIPPPGGTRVGGPEEGGPAGRAVSSVVFFFANEGETWGARCLLNWRNLRNGRRWSNPRSRPLLPSGLLARSLPSFLPSPFLVAQRAKTISHVNSRSLASWARTKFSAWLRRRWEPWGARLPCSFLAVFGAGTDWLIVQRQLSFCCCFYFVLPLSPTPTTLGWS